MRKQRDQLSEEIHGYAQEVAGSEQDLDPDLEGAGEDAWPDTVSSSADDV